MKTINVPRYARIFEILCMILIPIVLIISPLVWFFGDKLTDATYGINLAHFSLLQRAALSLVTLGSDGLIAYGLILLIRIARNFQKNIIFTAGTVALFMQLRRIAGWWMLYQSIFIVLFHSFVATTIPFYVTILSLATVALTYLFIFIFLSILVTLIIKATELQGDQDLTV